MLLAPLTLLLWSPAQAATLTTFPPDPAYTAAPFAGLESLVVDPVATTAGLSPGALPVPAEVQQLRSEARAPDTGLVFTNPTDTWAWLDLDGTRIGTIGPFATVRFDGLKAGSWRLDLTLPSGFVRKFAVITHIPDDDRPGVLAPVEVTLLADRIQLSERVYFEPDSAALQAVSAPWLDAAVALLVAHPEILQIRVEGHTDARGESGYNLALSAGRARSVRDYLVAHGLTADRVVSQGYGETRPIDTLGGEESLAKNRRVDFVILERAPEPAPLASPPTGPVKKRGR